MIVQDEDPRKFFVKNRILLNKSCYQNNTADEIIALMRPAVWYTSNVLQFLEDICSESLDAEVVRKEFPEGHATYNMRDGATKFDYLEGEDLLKAFQILDTLDSKSLLIALIQKQSNPPALLGRLKSMDRVESVIMKKMPRASS